MPARRAAAQLLNLIGEFLFEVVDGIGALGSELRNGGRLLLHVLIDVACPTQTLVGRRTQLVGGVVVLKEGDGGSREDEGSYVEGRGLLAVRAVAGERPNLGAKVGNDFGAPGEELEKKMEGVGRRKRTAA